MRKSEMRARLAAAEENIRALNRARAIDDANKKATFEEAWTDLQSGPVLVITATGKILRADVLKVDVETAQVDVSRGIGWAEFLPGKQTIGMCLTARPL